MVSAIWWVVRGERCVVGGGRWVVGGGRWGVTRLHRQGSQSHDGQAQATMRLNSIIHKADRDGARRPDYTEACVAV